MYACLKGIFLSAANWLPFHDSLLSGSNEYTSADTSGAAGGAKSASSQAFDAQGQSERLNFSWPQDPVPCAPLVP